MAYYPVPHCSGQWLLTFVGETLISGESCISFGAWANPALSCVPTALGATHGCWRGGSTIPVRTSTQCSRDSETPLLHFRGHYPVLAHGVQQTVGYTCCWRGTGSPSQGHHKPPQHRNGEDVLPQGILQWAQPLGMVLHSSHLLQQSIWTCATLGPAGTWLKVSTRSNTLLFCTVR